jgi:hypothetical protein
LSQGIPRDPTQSAKLYDGPRFLDVSTHRTFGDSINQIRDLPLNQSPIVVEANKITARIFTQSISLGVTK